MSNIDALFHPNAVAVCGGTGEGKLAAVIIKRLIDGGFPRVYAVNPKMQGYMSAKGYRSISDIQDDIDMIVVASPARTVAGVIEDAGRAGVKAAVIISSGFSESGDKALEAEVIAAARRYNIRCTGPNCAGLINTENSLYPTLEAAPVAGRTAVISQSGAVGGLIMVGGLKVSKFVSYGNGADLNETELLAYMAEDSGTDAIVMYVENIRNGRSFMDVLSAATSKKPVIMIKSGRTKSGSRAALSHTGSMAGSDAVYGAAFSKCGAIRAYSVEEAIDIANGLSCKKRPRGALTAIVTNSGGPGVMTADVLEEFNMDCSAPEDALKAELGLALPPFAGLSNPIDLTAQGDADMYRTALELMLKSYDAAIAVYVGTPYLQALPVARAVAEAAGNTDKPVLAAFDIGTDIDEALHVLREAGVPCFASGERAAKALFRMSVREPENLNIPQSAGRLNKSCVMEHEAMDILEGIGVPTPKRAFAADIDEAVSAAERIGFPVCVKVVSPAVIHKSDVGGVRLNIADKDGVKAAFSNMRRVGGPGFAGVMIYPMLPGGTEVIMGLTRDAQFGPVAAFGLGGIYTEALGDISIGIAPLTYTEAMDMIMRSKAYKLLKGARGAKGADIAALADMLVKLSRLMFLHEDISEVDINPVFARPDGAVAADARIITEDMQ